MDTVVIDIQTGRQRAVVDLTDMIERFLRDKASGLLSVFVPHATAGVALIETHSGTEADLLTAIDGLLPREDIWQHRHGARGHGADHVLPAFISPSMTVPVREGQMLLGTWQSVVLVDTNIDNPARQVRLSFLEG